MARWIFCCCCCCPFNRFALIHPIRMLGSTLRSGLETSPGAADLVRRSSHPLKSTLDGQLNLIELPQNKTKPEPRTPKLQPTMTTASLHDSFIFHTVQPTPPCFSPSFMTTVQMAAVACQTQSCKDLFLLVILQLSLHQQQLVRLTVSKQKAKMGKKSKRPGRANHEVGNPRVSRSAATTSDGSQGEDSLGIQLKRMQRCIVTVPTKRLSCEGLECLDSLKNFHASAD